jgi:ribosomal protein S9
MENSYLIVAGKRKTSIAKARISDGNGKITINNFPYESLLSRFHILMIREPLDIAKKVLGEIKFNISVEVRGGGTESRIEASRLAVAKSIVKFTKSAELRKAYSEYDKTLLVADTRRKEPYKPGDSKARSKRQKSYR